MRPQLAAWFDGREFHTHPAVLRAAELSRQATALLAAGNGDAAIASLRAEREIMDEVELGWGAQSFLRLPLYLQRAGRSAEAWSEFLALFERFTPSAYPGKFSSYWDIVRVYDKARLFMQRERKPTLASCYSVATYLSEAAATQHRGLDRSLPASMRREDREFFKEMSTPEAIEAGLARDLKRAGLLNRLSDLVPWVQSTLASLPLPKHDALIAQIRTVLRVTEQYPALA